MRMRIAIATCRKKPEGTTDDEHLIQALKARGHEPANLRWDTPTADWSQFDITLLRSPWDYYERLPEFLAWAEKADQQTRLLNPLATVKTNAEKDYLLDLEKQGFPVPRSLVFTAAQKREALERARAELRKGPLVLKPTVSGGSYLTYFVKTESELEPAIENILRHGKLLLQPYLPTIETQGEVSLIYFRVGKAWRFSHAVLKNARSGDFRVQTDFGGSTVPWEPNLPCLALSERLLETLSPHDLYARIDLVDWQTEPKVGELELIEPALFFAQAPHSAPLLVEALEAL